MDDLFRYYLIKRADTHKYIWNESRGRFVVLDDIIRYTEQTYNGHISERTMEGGDPYTSLVTYATANCLLEAYGLESLTTKVISLFIGWDKNLVKSQTLNRELLVPWDDVQPYASVNKSIDEQAIDAFLFHHTNVHTTFVTSHFYQDISWWHNPDLIDFDKTFENQFKHGDSIVYGHEFDDGIIVDMKCKNVSLKYNGKTYNSKDFYKNIMLKNVIRENKLEQITNLKHINEYEFHVYDRKYGDIERRSNDHICDLEVNPLNSTRVYKWPITKFEKEIRRIHDEYCTTYGYKIEKDTYHW
jgi:hypothetical protein